ncbi:MAG: NAD-dependent epimerase/dehydratase family protein [Candidatus Dormibacteria bacterium]
MTRRCLVTGAAGFIGSHLTRQLLDSGWLVTGIDGFTDSYDPAEKFARAELLQAIPGFSFVSGDILDIPLEDVLSESEVVFHLAGRAGVRASFESESRYVHDNVDASHRLLEACTRVPAVRRLVYASSSSVYGNGTRPFRETGEVAPISPYGRTKLAAERELLAVTGGTLETVALRYFTVYGPGQRPDMGLRLFAEAALDGRPIVLFGDGTQSRDFTFVDDVARATVLAADAPVSGLVVNIGGGTIVSLLDVFDLLRSWVGPLQIDAQPVATGDVSHTEADHSRAREALGFRAAVEFSDGYRRQVDSLRELRSRQGLA